MNIQNTVRASTALNFDVCVSGHHFGASAACVVGTHEERTDLCGVPNMQRMRRRFAAVDPATV